jgi:hypothetical protein
MEMAHGSGMPWNVLERDCNDIASIGLWDLVWEIPLTPCVL